MQFRKWFLQESISVYIDGMNQHDTVDNLSDLSHYLFRLLAKIPAFSNAARGYDTLAPDGTSVFNRTGILNFYTKGISQPDVVKILSGIKYYLSVCHFNHN